MSPFTTTNVSPGINCYNYYIWDKTSDLNVEASLTGWVRFTSPTSLILNVGTKSNGYIGTKISTLEEYRIKAINVDLATSFAYVPLKITVNNECTSTTLT